MPRQPNDLMAKYSVLHHRIPPDSGREDHFDLLLENGIALTTWEFPEWPPGDIQSVRRLPDHRMEYLEFEGELTGNRGNVRRVCQGTYRFISQTDQLWAIELTGGTFSGAITLTLGSSTHSEYERTHCWIASADPAAA